MTDDIRAVESVHEALLCLYDPPALAATPLAAELVERAALTTPRALSELLLAAIEQLKPLEPAPRWSHGWRCYRYLQLRYVECQSHASIAQELGISLRQASRVHHEALGILSGILRSGTRPAMAPAAGASPSGDGARPIARDHARTGSTGLSWHDELAAVGRQPPDAAVDLAAVTRGVVETLHSLARQHRVEVVDRLPDDLPPARVNRVALRQIQLNLLLYAIQRARGPDAAESTTVSIRGNHSDAAVTLALWWDVTTRPPPRPIDGDRAASGESEPELAAARYLAGLQGGTIEDVQGEGPAVGLQLRLPLSKKRRVLLIDDNPDVGKLFRRMLGESDYHLGQVRTASHALNHAREALPDVIILDVVMPSRDGWEVLTALRGDPTTARIPVVVCSVLPDRDLALSLGAADFLAKPVTRATLVRTLARLG